MAREASQQAEVVAKANLDKLRESFKKAGDEVNLLWLDCMLEGEARRRCKWGSVPIVPAAAHRACRSLAALESRNLAYVLVPGARKGSVRT